MGAKFKNVIGMGEVSGNGLPGETGILALDVPQFSQAAAYGLKQYDVILELDGKRTDSLKDLKRFADEVPNWENCNLTVWRKQQKATVILKAPWR
jgi:S1-C subfamily serine protease